MCRLSLLALAFPAALLSLNLSHAQPPATSDPAPVVQAYLDAKMPEEIGRVSVSADDVTIRGKLAGDPSGLALAEVPIEKLLTDPGRYADFLKLTLGKDGEFQVRTPRKIERDGRSHDRLLSKWQLVRRSAEGKAEPVSHARFADEVACRAPGLPEIKPKSKKAWAGGAPRASRRVNWSGWASPPSP